MDIWLLENRVGRSRIQNVSLDCRVQELLLGNWRDTGNGETIFNERHGQPRRYRQGTFEQGFAISGFNFNDRLERGTVIHERVASRVPCATLREHSPLFEFIWHEASVRSDSDGSYSRSAALRRHFRTIRWRNPPLYHLPFGPALPGYIPRIICLFRSPHTSSPPGPFPACVSPCSSAQSIDGDVDATRYVFLER